MTDERRRMAAEQLKEITALLQDRVEDLAPILLPEGRREGSDWRAGSRGGRSIALRGVYRGVYRDFESGEKGCDMLQAVADILCSGSLRDAIAWSRSYLGLADMNAEALELARRKASERQARAAKDRSARDRKRQKQAAGIWHGGAPIAGTPADEYLQGRGIDLRRLARPPSALRYNPETWCKDRRGKFPAMVSALFRFDAPELVATHRTFLEIDAAGVVKAPIDTPRSILGSWPGAVIPIQRGETGRRWKDIEEGEILALGEGVEEGLSVALVQPEWRVGAVGFVGNFGQIKLPSWCHIMLCINNDPPGSEAHRAIFGDPDKGRAGAAAALEAAGHVVRVLRPPAAFKDWNDVLTGKTIDK